MEMITAERRAEGRADTANSAPAAARETLHVLWRTLARRNDWTLVVNEAAFLDQAAAELQMLTGGSAAARQRLALQRSYSALLYQGLGARQERAAHELWLAFVRLGLRAGHARTEAEELAQEAISRVLARLSTLRTPQSLLIWAFTIWRTVQREGWQQGSREQELPADETDQQFLAVPNDLVEDVVDGLIDQSLFDLLTAHLTNDLERVVLLRVVVWGDHPRDVARDLNLPLYRARLAKSRALQRLRANTEFIARLTALTDQLDETSSAW